MRQYRPCLTGILVCQCHARDVKPAPFQQRPQPTTLGILFVAQMPQCRACTMNQQLAQVTVMVTPDLTNLDLTPSTTMTWCQTQVSTKITTIAKISRISHLDPQGTRTQYPYTT